MVVPKEMSVPVNTSLWEDIVRTLQMYAERGMYRSTWNGPAPVVKLDSGEQARAVLKKIEEKGLPMK